MFSLYWIGFPPERSDGLVVWRKRKMFVCLSVCRKVSEYTRIPTYQHANKSHFTAVLRNVCTKDVWQRGLEDGLTVKTNKRSRLGFSTKFFAYKFTCSKRIFGLCEGLPLQQLSIICSVSERFWRCADNCSILQFTKIFHGARLIDRNNILNTSFKMSRTFFGRRGTMVRFCTSMKLLIYFVLLAWVGVRPDSQKPMPQNRLRLLGGFGDYFRFC